MKKTLFALIIPAFLGCSKNNDYSKTDLTSSVCGEYKVYQIISNNDTISLPTQNEDLSIIVEKVNLEYVDLYTYSEFTQKKIYTGKFFCKDLRPELGSYRLWGALISDTGEESGRISPYQIHIKSISSDGKIIKINGTR